MAGLLQFPTREVPCARDGTSALFPAAWPGRGPGFEHEEPIGEIRHSITHHRIHANVYRSRIAPSSAQVAEPLIWVPHDEARERALTGMARKVLRILVPSLGAGSGRVPRLRE
jgi:adenine-specific DNA glycosylase